MSGFQSLLLSYALNSLWQVALLSAIASIAARAIKPAGPAAEHRVWVGALLLESLLPALSIVPWERMHIAWPWFGHPAAMRGANVSVEVGAGAGLAALRIPPAALTAAAIAYGVITFYFTVRFVWQWMRLRALVRGTEPVALAGDAAIAWRRGTSRFGVGSVALMTSTDIFAPVTMGIARQRVLVPAGMMNELSHGDLDTAITHELAHIRRNDFLKNLVYEMLSLPMRFHPAFWLTRQRVMETREMVCDEMAAEISGNHEYAQSLLRLATLLLQGRPVGVPQAIGVFDANTLEKRLMKLTEKKRVIGRVRLYGAIGACVVLAAATAGSALALRLAVDSGADSQASQKAAPLTVAPAKMAAQVLSKVTPVYPPEAKKARIQGKVVLNAVIGKAGHVENLKVVSGPNELQQSALDAVRQWTYKPFLLNGEPIEVKTSISVIYTLQK